jgi:hypothetical protein
VSTAAKIATVALCVALGTPQPAAADSLSADQLARLKAGEALVSVEEDSGEADGHIEAAIEIPA